MNVVVRPRAGSIPACAGEPICQRFSSPAWGVYPRVCGGTDDTKYQYELAAGLSPRVRGNPPQGLGTVVHIGSIPACAGEPVCPVCWGRLV